MSIVDIPDIPPTEFIGADSQINIEMLDYLARKMNYITL